MEQFIGIIIQNQYEKILLYDNKYYIETKLNENEDVHSVISTKLKRTINQGIYKLIKTHIKISKESKKHMTMYIVEVNLFNNNYVFVDKEKLLKLLSDSEDKFFFEKYIIRYENYKHLIYSITISLLILPILIGIPPQFEISPSKNLLLIQIGLAILLYLIFVGYLVPTCAQFLVNFKINSKLLITLFDWTGFILIIFNLIKIFNT